MIKFSFVVRGALLALGLTGVASAAPDAAAPEDAAAAPIADDAPTEAPAKAAPKAATPAPNDRGPEINPYECLGRYEAATGNRSMSQVAAELDKRLHPLFEGDEPHTVKAMKLCVVAMLESRLGNGDASKHYEMAIQEDPEEPGYEYWYGHYWSGFRGARGIVVEKAEDHFYKALEKVDAKRRANKFREYHGVVEEWTRKQLLVSYQEDGLHFLPWAKTYPQHGYAGHDVPSLAVSAQFSISKDTRDFFRNNEMRNFTGELMFANGPYRAAGLLSAAQIYSIVRAPVRYREDIRLRLRQNLIGAIDFSAANEKMVAGQISSYYLPPPGGLNYQLGATVPSSFTDVNLQEYGVGYERVFPLYPLFDFKLAGDVKHMDRQGVVEFEPGWHEKFWMYEVRPSFSRFVGPDKVTLDLTYAYLNVTDVKGGSPAERLRAKYIRAINLEYALYRPMVLPEFRGGSLGAHRTPTRGWYFNAGAADDDDVYGVRTVRKHDFYLGSRFEGAGNYDFWLQGTYSTSKLTELDVGTGATGAPPIPLESASFRTTAILQRRIINPDAIPGINGSFLAPDMVNLVVPVTWDKGISGTDCSSNNDAAHPLPYNTTYTSAKDCYKTFENVRVGAEIWAKFFGTGFGGPSFLTTVGYDYQYFYQIKKAVNEFHVNLRMGWGRL